MPTLTIDAELDRTLESLGAKDDDAKSRFVREAVMEALEDREWARIAEERLARPEAEFSLEDVEREFCLDG